MANENPGWGYTLASSPRRAIGRPWSSASRLHAPRCWGQPIFGIEMRRSLAVKLANGDIYDQVPRGAAPQHEYDRARRKTTGAGVGLSNS
jgi:hypothetical protein